MARNNRINKTKRINSLKGLSFIIDDEGNRTEFDAIVQTIMKSRKSKRARSGFYALEDNDANDIISRLELDIESDCVVTEKDGVFYALIGYKNDSDKFVPEFPSMSELHGLVIDGETLSKSCELSVYSELFFGYEDGIFTHNDIVRTYNFSLSQKEGVNCYIDSKGKNHPLFKDYSVAFSNEMIDINGEELKIRDHKVADALIDYDLEPDVELIAVHPVTIETELDKLDVEKSQLYDLLEDNWFEIEDETEDETEEEKVVEKVEEKKAPAKKSTKRKARKA